MAAAIQDVEYGGVNAAGQKKPEWTTSSICIFGVLAAAVIAAVGAGVGVALTSGSIRLPSLPGEDLFNIRVAYSGDSAYNASVSAAAEQAKARWEAVITKGLRMTIPEPDPTYGCLEATSTLSSTGVDDLLISIEVRDLGVDILSEYVICYYDTDDMPRVGILRYSPDYVAQLILDGTLNSSLAHNMGHILGIGVDWEDKNLLTAGIFTYKGAQGNLGHREIGGNGSSALVENNEYEYGYGTDWVSE